MAVFCVVVPCSLVEVYGRFRGACCLYHLPDYTAQQPRRQPSSYSPPWEPELSLIYLNSNVHQVGTQFLGVTLTRGTDVPSSVGRDFLPPCRLHGARLGPRSTTWRSLTSAQWLFDVTVQTIRDTAAAVRSSDPCISVRIHSLLFRCQLQRARS
jgi:hypothetical protein